MTTSKAAKTPTTVEQPAENVDELARLRAEKQRLDAELKAAREKAATQRKAERAEADAHKLERVVTRQTSNPRKSLAKGLGAALRGRMLAGQTREDATAAILEQCRALLDATADPTPRAPRTKAAQPDA